MPPSTTFEPTGNQDDTKGGKGDASGALSDHKSSAGGKVAVATPAEGLPPGVTLLRATRGGALLLAPSTQPLAGLSCRGRHRHAGTIVRRCDLVHLRLMVSVSLSLRD